MARKSRENPEIIDFILENVRRNPGNIATLTANHFEVTRVTANRYLSKLVERGALSADGETKARRYELKNEIDKTFELQLAPDTAEHIVWRELILPLLKDLPQNALEILEYGTNEMINNVIDHSEGKAFSIRLQRNALGVEIWITDSGVGIFKKIARECKLSDEREAILELSKGKLTTDPTRHTGEGIFFTSRMFQEFQIHSGRLWYSHEFRDGEDWLMEVESSDHQRTGTWVVLRLHSSVSYTVREVFSRYEVDEDGYGRFARTHVPVRLALYPNEQLVSRSQARRVLSRFDKFTEVLLDFKNVPTIGQAFADEIFRVFKNSHSEVSIIPIRTSSEVKDVIERAQRNQAPDQPGLFDLKSGS